jgi:uncharacterized protein (DUF302 family)
LEKGKKKHDSGPSTRIPAEKDDGQRIEWRRVMKYWWPALLFVVSVLSASEALAVQKEEGIVKIASHHSVDQTVDKLKTILQSKGVMLFALVDHSGEAEKVGLEMPPTKLLIFGNPKGGTPLMLASPGVAIDLPLKILVAEDSQGKVWISYNSPEYLKERHGLPENLLPNIDVAKTLAAAAGE